MEIIRGPQADLLLFTGPAPTSDTWSALQEIEKGVAWLGEHLRVHFVCPSLACASDAGLGENDPKVIVDGLEKLQSVFGIRAPELVYIRPDGYIGFRTRTLQLQQLRNYLGQIYRSIESDAVTIEFDDLTVRER